MPSTGQGCSTRDKNHQYMHAGPFISALEPIFFQKTHRSSFVSLLHNLNRDTFIDGQRHFLGRSRRHAAAMVTTVGTAHTAAASSATARSLAARGRLAAA